MLAPVWSPGREGAQESVTSAFDLVSWWSVFSFLLSSCSASLSYLADEGDNGHGARGCT